MELKGHLLYYPEGKHDINLNNYVQKSQLNDALKSKVDSITKTTYADLKNLRDNSQLIPGSLYRITDYNCTTTQENTRSAGHQFDIVLLALSKNKLAEEGWAMMNESNIYDVTFTDGVTKKCYIVSISDENVDIVDIETLLGVHDANIVDEIHIDEVTKTASMTETGYSSLDLVTPNLTYNYFQNSNLSAWKVWYCLDNDTDRFAWATTPSSAVYSLTISLGGYEVAGTAARDESRDFGEFKCFVLRLMTSKTYGWIKSETISVGTVTVYLEPSEDGATMELIITSVTELPPIKATGVIYRLIDEYNNDIKYDFKNIQFKRKITDGLYNDNGEETWCYTLNVWYNNMCQDASIVGNTLTNDMGYIVGVYDNVFGYIIGGEESTLTFALGNNVVLSINNPVYYGIYSNKIGNNFINNTIGEKFINNIIGNNFQQNKISGGFNSNRIGDYFNSNTIGSEFANNTISNYFETNTIGNNFQNNKIENSFSFNTIGSSFSNNTIGNCFQNNTTSANFHNNTIGDNVKLNHISNNFRNNKIGNSFENNTIIKDFVQYIRVEDGVQYVDITTSATVGSSNYLQNIIIGKGIKGTLSSRKTITHPTTNDEKQTTYVPTGSTQIEV